MGVRNHNKVRQSGRAVSAAAMLLGAGFGASATAQTSTPATPATPAAEVSPWSAPEPWRTDRFYFQTSVATRHFHPKPEHVNTQDLVNLEWRFNSFAAGGQWLAGGGTFRNSFGQPSQYVYGGLLVRPLAAVQPLYFKITGGAIHGYKGEYKDKIPLNSQGVAPVVLPAVGYCYGRFCSELVSLGTIGAMLTLGITLP
jgi:hypothetical protein